MNECLFFTTPKAFTGPPAELQHNAFRSWKLLNLPVLVLGDDIGVGEAARTYGFHHHPTVSKSSDGVPLVRDVFAKAENFRDAPCYAYLNADIILTPALVRTIRHVSSLMTGQQTHRHFLLTAQRATIDSSDLDTIPDSDFFDTVEGRQTDEAAWDGLGAIDLFVYSKGLFEEMPPIVIGRTAWDNWLLWKARERGASVVDLSSAGLLVHQFHGYRTAGGWEAVWTGNDAARNIALADGKMLGLGAARTDIWDGERVAPWTDSSVELYRNDSRNIERRIALTAGVARRALAGSGNGPPEALGAFQICLQATGRYYSLWPAMGDGIPVESVLETVERISRKDLSQTERLTIVEDLMATPFIEMLRIKVLSQGRPLILWGAGGFAHRLTRVLVRHGLTSYQIVTSTDDSVGKTIHGGAVISSQSIGDPDGTLSRAFIVIATTAWRDVKMLLEQRGLQAGADFAG